MIPRQRLPVWVRATLGWAERLEEALVIGLLVAMVAIVSLQVFMRYVLNDPLLWTEVAARLVFTWGTFLGAALAFKYHYHIQIDVLVNLLPARARRAAELLARAITAALLLLLVVKGFSYVQITWAQRVAPYEFSYGMFALTVPVSATLMLLRVVLAPARWSAEGAPPAPDGGPV